MVFVCQLNVLWYTYNLNLASIVTRESWMNLGYLMICIVLLLWILYCWSKSFKMNFLLLEDVSCNDKFLFLYQQQWCKYYHYKWLLFPMAFCFPALLPAVSSVLCLVVREATPPDHALCPLVHFQMILQLYVPVISQILLCGFRNVYYIKPQCIIYI